MIFFQIIGAVIALAVTGIGGYVAFWRWYERKYPNPLLDAADEYLHQSRLEMAEILKRQTEQSRARTSGPVTRAFVQTSTGKIPLRQIQ